MFFESIFDLISWPEISLSFCLFVYCNICGKRFLIGFHQWDQGGSRSGSGNAMAAAAANPLTEDVEDLFNMMDN